MKTYKLTIGTWTTGITAGDINDAQEIADNEATYTQESMILSDDLGNELCRRNWHGCLDGIDGAENPIQFGDFGFYGDWQ